MSYIGNEPYEFIVDQSVSAGAAISGTKINPNFGFQNVLTTGTSTAASFIPTSSSVPTNGIYLNAANSVALATNGQGRLFIDALGNISIGSSATINSAGYATLGINGSTGGQIAFMTGGSARQYIFSSNTDLTLFNNNGPTILSNGGSERLRITSAGLVGVGTSSPQSPLQVQGNISSRNTANDSQVQLGNNGTYGFLSSTYGTTGAYTPLNLRTSDQDRLIIDTSGRVLVGTSSSVATANGYTPGLQVAAQVGSISAASYRADEYGGIVALQKSKSATVGTQTVVANGDECGILSFEGSDGSSFKALAQIRALVDGTPGANDMPGRLVFSTTADGASSPTERMRITKEGVLKASKNGSYLNADSGVHEIRSNLDNNNVLIVSSAASNGTQYGLSIRTANDQNDATRDFLECVGGGVLRAQIRSNGGLANYQANDVNLSDRNAKKDISPAADTWDCIKEWEIVNYRYKDQPDDADLNLGVIAQQVAESCPEVITVFEEAKDDQPEKLGIKEQQMYWMAIKALQEAQVRIEQLEAKVAALESA